MGFINQLITGGHHPVQPGKSTDFFDFNLTLMKLAISRAAFTNVTLRYLSMSHHYLYLGMSTKIG